jgi:dipeptidyl aminopeptidase/acylaminoacyl peptidase
VTYTVVDLALTGPAGSGTWFTGPVTVSIAGAGPSTTGVILTVDGQQQSSGVVVQDESMHTATLAIAGTSTPKIVSFGIDATPPSIAVTPTNVGPYLQNSTQTALVVCADATSLVKTCVPGGTVTLPTVTLGINTLSVTAVDNAGNQALFSFTYSVVRGLAGKVVFSRGGYLWTVKLNGQLEQLTSTSNGGGSDFQPARSPDGSQIVFVRNGRLALFDVMTNAVVPSPPWVGAVNASTAIAAGTVTAPAWSPDGSTVAFQAVAKASKDQDIWKIATSGTGTPAPVRLTTASSDDRTPTWSQDSARIVFSSNPSKGSFKLYVMNANGTGQSALTVGSSDDVQPAYSPDGALLAFSSNFAGGTGGFEIHVTRPLSGDKKTRITTINGDDGQPMWLDPNTIVFVSQLGTGSPGGSGLYWIAPTGGTVTKIPGTQTGDVDPG